MILLTSHRIHRSLHLYPLIEIPNPSDSYRKHSFDIYRIQNIQDKLRVSHFVTNLIIDGDLAVTILHDALQIYHDAARNYIFVNREF